MSFTPEMIAKARTSTSAEELINFADEEGITLSHLEAERYFAFLSGEETELPDEVLDEIAGGKGGEDEPAKPAPKFKVGQTVKFHWQKWFTVTIDNITTTNDGSYYYRMTDTANGNPLTLSAASLEDPKRHAEVIG